MNSIEFNIFYNFLFDYMIRKIGSAVDDFTNSKQKQLNIALNGIIVTSDAKIVTLPAS